MALYFLRGISLFSFYIAYKPCDHAQQCVFIDIGGGGGSTAIPGDTKNVGRLSVIVMDATTNVSFVDRANGTEVLRPSSAGEISAHEILGHQLAAESNSIHSVVLSSIQATNLYLRAQGITNRYRDTHVGLSIFDKGKVEDIPTFLK